ncbi:TonB-dependent receptor [Sediminibacterium sp.]|uniref:TonB-dependent receptor n=1 Tax=Sediminibacterium sp. TaxID=1917865 RepID=UPI0027359A5A|nr:TonB-dependent receptor [Sediminibacterium sp.]MDP3567576.1 TonB-dependent receptor [Sediminibacterium sp.]
MNKSTTKLIFVLALFCSILKSQTNFGFVKGFVTDAKTNDTLIGAIVNVSVKNAVTTNLQGFFELKLIPGTYTLQCSLVGYKTFKTSIEIKENETITTSILLEDVNTALDEVVISAGKFEQKLSDVTVSMDIIKPALIENKNVTNLDVIINQVPGVTVADGQVSIRGGSGFSYGAGSRVLMLVDEMPMISADAGDIKWNYLPLENIEQVEVIKGASSALFGSSALNGVINLRTIYAKEKPITKIISFFGSYDAPSKTYKWWKGTTQFQKGINISHAQKIGNLDFVIGAHQFTDDGFRMLETEDRQRFNCNLRYNFKKIPGLAVGVNTNMMNVRGGLFFLWQSYDSAYIPQGRTIQKYNNDRFNVDPFVTYFWKNNKLSLRNRYFKTVNRNDKNQGSNAELYYSELQYQKHFANNLNLTTGAVYMEQQVLGDSLYGKHSGQNIAAYVQADRKFFNRLTVSLGLRGEFYKLDTAKTVGYLFPQNRSVTLPFQPVARIGLNYQALEYTFIRASFGQGYRFPTVAEKFVSTAVSSLKIYPNNSLQPERGYSTEIGVKQGFKIAGFKGFFDAVAFYTKYQSMIEFVFNIYKPGGATGVFYQDIAYAGFKSQNIGEAQISGYETSVSGAGKIGPINVTVFSGYTYINPINPNFNAAKDTLGLQGVKTLKYRSKHLIKSDIQLDYKFLSIGYSARFQSKTENIDRRFVQSILHEYNDIANGVNWDEVDATYILPGLNKNFGEFQKSFWVHDARISVSLNKSIKISFIVNNLTNVSYQARPGDLRAPTQYVGQLAIKL